MLEALEKKVDEALNEALGEIYDGLGIESGDINPMQLIEWETNVHNVAILFEELIKFNA